MRSTCQGNTRALALCIDVATFFATFARNDDWKMSCRVAIFASIQRCWLKMSCRVATFAYNPRVPWRYLHISQRPWQTATLRWNSLSDGRLGHIVLRADGPATTHLCTFLHKIRCLLHNFACKNRDVLAPFCTFGVLSCKCHVESRHLPMNVCVNVYVVSRHMPKKLWFKT